jgi:hypothetical protein
MRGKRQGARIAIQIGPENASYLSKNLERVTWFPGGRLERDLYNLNSRNGQFGHLGLHSVSLAESLWSIDFPDGVLDGF